MNNSCENCGSHDCCDRENRLSDQIAQQAVRIANLTLLVTKNHCALHGYVSHIQEQAAEIERLKEAAIELLDALSEEQYSTTPPKAWPSIAPAANRLSDLVTRLEDS
jgi:hypothetical protein